MLKLHSSNEFNRDSIMNIRAVYAAYTSDEIRAARAAFDQVILDKIDEEIASDENFCGLTGFHMRFGIRAAVFHAANTSGMRPRDIYILLDGEGGDFDRASRVRYVTEGVPFVI